MTDSKGEGTGRVTRYGCYVIAGFGLSMMFPAFTEQWFGAWLVWGATIGLFSEVRSTLATLMQEGREK